MKGRDALRQPALSACQEIRIAGFIERRLDLGHGQTKSFRIEPMAIETLGQIDDGPIALAFDPFENRTDVSADIDFFFALGGDQRVEGPFEVGIARSLRRIGMAQEPGPWRDEKDHGAARRRPVQESPKSSRLTARLRPPSAEAQRRRQTAG